MNAWQGFALGFLAGSIYVMFVLPWLSKTNLEQRVKRTGISLEDGK